ncbi:MAG: formimidoylglutamase [Imperialibacter sp.]
MDFKLFFDPVSSDVTKALPKSAFLKSIRIFSNKMPDLKNTDIAIVGIKEHRGENSGEGIDQSADAIRKKLYGLSKGLGKNNIVDLGNLRNGPTAEDTVLRLKEVVQSLLEKDILPIIVGGSHDIDYGQYMAYEAFDKMISVLGVDSSFDLEDDKKASDADRRLHRILVHQPNYLFNYTHLAFQTYLVDQQALNIVEKFYFEAVRLGVLRESIDEMEPSIRQADMLSFDISALSSIYAPGGQHAQVFGLTGEEACQICWYAGNSEKLSSAGFYGYNLLKDDIRSSTAMVTATMIWYFIEGYYHRKDDRHFREKDYTKYVVSMNNQPSTITFFKSQSSEKWWMEVPYPGGKAKYSRNSIVPCSYKDYETATKGEIPERWMTTHAKLN